MVAQAPAPPYQRGLAFLAGVGFAAVPAFGPFLALLAMATGRLELQRADRWWWLSALLLGGPMALTTGLVQALAASAQILATWLIFRCATEVRHRIRGSAITIDVGTGLVVGLATTLVLGLRQFDGFRWETARTLFDAMTWQAHPAIFGHTMVVLSALLAIVVPSAGLRVIALTLGAVGVVLSGAREAMFAWLIIAIGLRFVGRRGGVTTKLAEWALIGVMVLLAAGALNQFGIGRTGFLTAFAPSDAEVNLFRGTEVVDGDWWYPLGVSVVGTRVMIDGVERTGFTVTKQWQDTWARLQQVVELAPGQTYTLSAAWQPHGEARPGFDGWGQVDGSDADVVLSTFVNGDTHAALGSGGIVVLSSSSTKLEDGWERAQVTFQFAGESSVVWYVGMVPDRSNVAGVSTTFAEVQLSTTEARPPYVPGMAERGVSNLSTSRLPIWRDALAAISARPLLGWGEGGLPTAIHQLHPDVTRIRPVAAHAHNIFLTIWVDRGLVGLAGLVVLLVVLALRTVQHRDRAVVVVLLGIGVMNLLDATLLSGTVIYPLAAILGWRAVGHRPLASAETGPGSAAAVRLSLALGDALAGAAAISLALVTTSGIGGWTSGLSYATLVWPLMAGVARLYPGYGRTSPNELSGSVTAAGAASLLLTLGATLLPNTFPLPPPALVTMVGSSLLLAPAIRYATKKSLRALHLWGRPAVLLGTGASAERTATHLLANPGLGIHLVAVFGSSNDWKLQRLPITGSLEHAWRYITDNNVRHAIVTSDAAQELGFDEVLRRADRQLRFVQFLPDLKGLPSSSVVATPLGSALALEVRNQLASGTNRAVKRIIDVAVSTLMLSVLALPLAIVAIIIRLDSPGPVLHLSPRLGRYGRTFSCIKFRTMYADAQQRLEHILATEPSKQTEYHQFRKLSNDPRVTRVGRVLRRLSLDEFPQLINVVVGQMSMVGPRPYLVTEFDAMGPDRDLILLARPGITGYWQVEARNDVDFEERQVMEADYVRNWSVWWDMVILFSTPMAMLGPDGK